MASSHRRVDFGFKESHVSCENNRVDIELVHAEESPVVAHKNLVMGKGDGNTTKKTLFYNAVSTTVVK